VDASLPFSVAAGSGEFSLLKETIMPLTDPKPAIHLDILPFQDHPTGFEAQVEGSGIGLVYITFESGAITSVTVYSDESELKPDVIEDLLQQLGVPSVP
jgi:hypothetical protein